MPYQMAAVPVTLSGLQGRSSHFKWDFSYSCEAVDNISTVTSPSVGNIEYRYRCRYYRRYFWKISITTLTSPLLL